MTAEPFIYINLKKVRRGTDHPERHQQHECGSGNPGQKGWQWQGHFTQQEPAGDYYTPDAYARWISIQTEKEESRKSNLRMKNARERLESLYPDAYTLDVILSNSAFTVSLILKSKVA